MSVGVKECRQIIFFWGGVDLLLFTYSKQILSEHKVFECGDLNPRLQDEKRQSHLSAMPPHRGEISGNKIEIKKAVKKNFRSNGEFQSGAESVVA